jgi:hypothetical protein
METSDRYTQIIGQVNELTDNELIDLSKYVQEMIAVRQHMANYDPAKDPILTGEGLFDGPPDLSERVKEIVRRDDAPIETIDEQR